MLNGIDHVVVLVRDLEQASRDYEGLGFRVTPGGEHAGGETHNSLIGFDDGAYFELIAFKEPDRPHSHRWWPRLARGEGLVDYALSADDVAIARDDARQRGLELVEPVEGSRRLPDGQGITWRSLTSGRPTGTSIVPFVIEDVTPRGLRVPHGERAQHPLGRLRVAGVTLVTRDLESASRDLVAMLGSEPSPSSRIPGVRSIRFELGPQWFEVLQPGRDQPATSEEGSPAEHLEKYGEGPFEVVLADDRAAGPGDGRLLATQQAHGARIRVAG